MQISNNYQLNFQAGKGVIQRSAELAIKERMPNTNFEELKDNFEKMCKNTNLEVFVDTTSKESIRLKATVMHNNKFRHYEEETILSSIFCKPDKFFSNVKKAINEKVIPNINRPFVG